MERIRDRDPEIFLACVQIFRPDFFGTRPFRHSDNHPIVEVDSILRVGFGGAPHQIGIWFD